MDNNSLDSFVNGGLDSTQNTTITSTGEVNVARPKLRKIKRPKIRPSSDIPSAPQKEMPIETKQALNNDSTDEVINDASGENNAIVSLNDVDALSDVNYDNPYSTQPLPPDYDLSPIDNITYDNSDYVKKNLFITVSVICLFVGLFLGKSIFSSSKVEKHGLEGVVMNEDVPTGRARCGLTDKSQACVFYLMNWYKQELNGRDFYKLAAQLTGREEYMIETDNLRYATVKIKPGHFAQLNIPALK
jgi:hypothetical protein